ncbi:MAG TPA: hypothetical protein VGK03_01120 [Geothrix sp.]
MAASETVRLEAIGRHGLEDLLIQGFIQKDERPLQASLEGRYEALQETHRQVVEAKGCADRLQRRMAPKSRLAGLLPMGAPTVPSPNDPDAVQLVNLLEILKIRVRGVTGPQDVPPLLDRILDYLQVEGRECLDRLAATDREIDQLQKQTPPGTQVEGEGYFRLTAAGEAALPEAPVIELFEASLQTAFGPSHRGGSYHHFKEDPSSLLALLVDRMLEGDRPSAVVSEYEGLLEAFDRIPVFADLHPLRAKIAFLVRLQRASKDEPKRAYLWCNRERLSAATQRMQAVLPPTVAASGWRLPYAADLFLADGGRSDDEDQAEQRARLFEAVHRIQTDLLQDIRIRDGQFFRLALVLAHAARIRNFAPGILMDRFIRQALEAVLEAAQAAPYDLGDRGTTLIFGTHLANAAGFVKARLTGPMEAFAAIHARFREGDSPTRLSTQVLLHVFATLDRLDRLGVPLPLEVYADLFDRIRKRLRHHKASSRAFSTAQIKAGDEAALASNLCAQVCFRGLSLPPRSQYHADVGLAGLYEDRTPGRPPLLGSPFGTLMLI